MIIFYYYSLRFCTNIFCFGSFFFPRFTNNEGIICYGMSGAEKKKPGEAPIFVCKQVYEEYQEMTCHCFLKDFQCYFLGGPQFFGCLQNLEAPNFSLKSPYSWILTEF